ncbi:uncharacterized protein [Euphorbia lathyris]|uniref:uncharacterized protein n=1 Tax=Euphorbia lathyris TaxID=212925 RepID=UPI00331409D9
MDSYGNEEHEPREQELEPQTATPAFDSVKQTPTKDFGSISDPNYESAETPFAVKVNPNESPNLNFSIRNSHTFQGSMTRVARPRLTTLVDPLHQLDLSFMSKRISGLSSSHVPAASAESIQVANETIIQCLILKLTTLDSAQVSFLKSAIMIFSTSLTSKDSRDLLTYLAQKISNFYEELHSDTTSLLQLEEENSLLHSIRDIRERAATIAKLDQEKERQYEAQEKEIQELQECIRHIKVSQKAVYRERAQLAVEQQKDLAKLAVFQEKVMADHDKMEKQVHEVDDLNLKCVSRLEA